MNAKEIREKAGEMLKGKLSLTLAVSMTMFGAAVLLLVLAESALLVCGVLDYESGMLVLSELGRQLPVLAGFFVLLAAAWLLIGSPLQQGKAAWFFAFAAGRYPSLDRMFSAFGRADYGRCVDYSVRLFFRQLLWYGGFSLPGLLVSGIEGFYPLGVTLAAGGLFLGAVLGQRFFLGRYILATSEEVTGREALRLSKALTKGHRGELFLLRLSFLGWFLLTVPTVGLSLIYTIPYYNTAMSVFAKELLDWHAAKEAETAENAE